MPLHLVRDRPPTPSANSPISEDLTPSQGAKSSEIRVLALTAKQMGLITLAQALALGMSRKQIRSRVDRGIWEVAHRGVYGIAGLGDWPARALLAAVLTGGPYAVASHRSAAWLWNLCPEVGVPEISVPRHLNPQIRGVIVHRSGDLEAAGVHRRLRIPTTSPLRALVDAGAVVRRTKVQDMLDRGVARKLLTPMGALAELQRLSQHGRSGCGPLRAILDDAGVTGSHKPSVLEAKSRRVLRRAGLPDPVCEMVAGSNGEYRLDFPYPEAMLDVEVDGWDCHSSFDAVHADLNRQNHLTALGYAFLRYTWRHVTREPQKMIDEVRTVYFQRLKMFSEDLTP